MITVILISIALLLLWVGLGLISFGYIYNYYQSEFPSIAEADESRDFHRIWGEMCWGAIGLLTTVDMDMTVYGLRFRRYKYIKGVRQI